jgi:hypothetical protein
VVVVWWWGSSSFLSVSCHVKAFHGLGIQGAKVSSLPGASSPPSVPKLLLILNL